MNDDCCDDDGWDDDLPGREEPNCYACSDSGCVICRPHTKGCDCAECFEAAVDEYEVFDHPDNVVDAAELVDEAPF